MSISVSVKNVASEMVDNPVALQHYAMYMQTIQAYGNIYADIEFTKDLSFKPVQL